jgi:hypothetical protein
MNAPVTSSSVLSSWARAWRLHWSLAALLLAATGCIIIPLPEMDSGDTRSNISKQTPGLFTPGKTTRMDVVLALGEPDLVTPDERKLAYRREKIVGIWILAAGNTATGGNIETDRYLVAEFDAAGVLNKIEFSRHAFGSADPVQMLGVAAVAVEQDASIRHQSWASWLAGVKNYKSPGDPGAAWVDGRLVLTDTELRFFSGSQFANEPAVFVFPYTAIRDVQMERFYFSHFLVIYERTGANHGFRVWGSTTGAKKRETVRSTYDFLRSKLIPSQP